MVSDDGTLLAVPRRVRWKVVNLQGWVECQFDGVIAATQTGMARHELVFHGAEEGISHIVSDLEGRVIDMHSMLAKLPRRAGLSLFGWRRR